MEQKIKLLAMLADGKLLSGQALADEAGVSRASISQWVNQLELCGLQFNRVKGKGYRLVTPIQFISRQSLLEQLSKEVRCKLATVDVSAEAESTNDIAMKASYTPGEWKLFTTEYQSAGKGRRGRSWISPPCTSLTFSLGLKNSFDLPLLYVSSLVAGIAIASVLRDNLNIDAKIKWPNDVYIGQSKVAGILCELQGRPQDEGLLVIGVGLNVFLQPDVDLRTGIGATSLASETVLPLDRTALLASFVDRLISIFDEVESNGLDWFFGQWADYDLLSGREIRVLKGDQVIEGTADGVDHSGQLRLRTERGDIALFSGGEVSVRWD